MLLTAPHAIYKCKMSAIIKYETLLCNLYAQLNYTEHPCKINALYDRNVNDILLPANIKSMLPTADVFKCLISP